MTKKMAVLTILLLVAIFCSIQPALTYEDRNILSIGNLSGELVDWDIYTDIWHGSVGINMTVLMENKGDSEIVIHWDTENTKGENIILGNWHGEVTLKVMLNIITRKISISIYGL